MSETFIPGSPVTTSITFFKDGEFKLDPTINATEIVIESDGDEDVSAQVVTDSDSAIGLLTLTGLQTEDQTLIVIKGSSASNNWDDFYLTLDAEPLISATAVSFELETLVDGLPKEGVDVELYTTVAPIRLVQKKISDINGLVQMNAEAGQYNVIRQFAGVNFTDEIVTVTI